MNFRNQNIHPRQKKSSIAFIIKLIVFVILISSIFIYSQYKQYGNKTFDSQSKIVQIQSGDTFGNISTKLGVHSIYYKFYIKNNIPDFDLQEGKYQLPESGTITEIIESLKTPILPEEINITLLEGWNIFDIDKYLSDKGLIKKGEYIKYSENPEKIIALTEFFPFIKGSITLEGYLYPDTYTVDSSNFKINVFVIRQLEAFETKVYNNLFKNTDITINNFQSVINLASIVEKEEKNSQYKKTVAGILKKRLKAGWMIGADITVCYPYRLTANECKMVVSKYIRDKNEYNTRTMIGLPKTPIGNPSYETIEATLNHKETPYWYYLHNIASGKIYYGKTNTEHEANKKYMY